MTEPVWLELEDVLKAHDGQITRFELADAIYPYLIGARPTPSG